MPELPLLRQPLPRRDATAKMMSLLPRMMPTSSSRFLIEPERFYSLERAGTAEYPKMRPTIVGGPRPNAMALDQISIGPWAGEGERPGSGRHPFVLGLKPS